MTAIPLDQSVGRDAWGIEHAEFRRFVCWSPDRVSRVMDTEALQTLPEVFLATHSTIPLYRGDLSAVGGETALSLYSEEQCLRDFLAPEDFAFVAVLGGAGTGKSHLIRWLSTRIRDTARRRVLLIPRAGSSLHEILRRILDGVEGERFDDYRERLTTANMAMSLDQARVRLLDNLAIAIGESGSVEGALTDEQDYLAAELPHLLRDPVFRPQFLQPGGVLDRLGMQLVGAGGVERVEERRVFTVHDLPLAFTGVALASQLAQGVYRDLVANQGLKQAAVAWLNRHLDEAVSQLMRMSGTDLLSLMIDVRAALAATGVELVVLIEDLATLQGIDQQLLEALIIRPRQPNMPDLCALRTAVAMTSGYYEGLRTNVHQRFDFRVVMGESDTRGEVAPRAVEVFTSRYLNAARLEPGKLAEWHRQESEAEEGQTRPVPSACVTCRFRNPCHAAFGAHDGMGLYPFTSTAVANIAGRVSPAGFNPRTLLKEGYKPILENYASALSAGRFPPPELLQRLGDSRLTALTEAELQQRDPTNRRRRAVLLDLWSDGRSVRDLDPVIHKAFDLPELGIRRDRDGDRDPEADPDAHEIPRGAAEEKLHRQLSEVDAWRAGGTMSQTLAQSLREVVYPAVFHHIDWNSLHLIPGEFAGSGKNFRQANSIVFARQFLQGGQAAIRLPIPLNDDEDPTDAAVALQGLLQFRHTRSWVFPDGGKFYRAYLRQVDNWSRYVVSQINQVTESTREWDPIPAAVELLAVGSRILGRPKSREPERPEIVDALLAEPAESDDGDRSEGWQTLATLVRKYQSKTRDLVLSRVACSKGDSKKLQIIDVSHFLPTLSEVRRNWRPVEMIPGDLVRSLKFLAEYRKGIDELLEQAVQDERTHQIDRYEAIVRQIGAEDCTAEEASEKRSEAIEALRRALAAAVNAGVLAGVQKVTFEEKLAEFEAVHFGAWVDSVARIRIADDSPRLLAELSVVPANARRVAIELFDLADRLMTRTEASVRQGMAGDEGHDARAVDEVQRAISDGLDTLVAGVSVLAGVGAAL